MHLHSVPMRAIMHRLYARFARWSCVHPTKPTSTCRLSSSLIARRCYGIPYRAASGALRVLHPIMIIAGSVILGTGALYPRTCVSPPSLRNSAGLAALGRSPGRHCRGRLIARFSPHTATRRAAHIAQPRRSFFMRRPSARTRTLDARGTNVI